MAVPYGLGLHGSAGALHQQRDDDDDDELPTKQPVAASLRKTPR